MLEQEKGLINFHSGLIIVQIDLDEILVQICALQSRNSFPEYQSAMTRNVTESNASSNAISDSCRGNADRLT